MLSMIFYTNGIIHIRKDQKEKDEKDDKIKIQNFVTDWFSNTFIFLTKLNAARDKSKRTGSKFEMASFLFSAVDVSLPTLIDEICNFWYKGTSLCTLNTKNVIKVQLQTFIKTYISAKDDMKVIEDFMLLA